MKKGGTENIKGNKRLLRRVGAAAFCCMVIAVVALLGTGYCGEDSFARIGLMMGPPRWVDYKERTQNKDGYSLMDGKKRAVLAKEEDNDRTPDDETDGALKALQKADPEKGMIWSAPKEYRVQDGVLTDIDRDGDTEMVLLVWKRGRFGAHRPFWVLRDEKCYSQHIFIYDIDEDGQVKQKWFASDIGMQVRRMKLMERDSSLLLTEDTEGDCALWQWDSFGLKSMDNEVKFVAFGDNIIHKAIYEYAYGHEKGSFDFLYEPFEKEIAGADVSAVNAETVLVDKNSAVSDYPRFGSPLAVGTALKNVGFDVISCANNHALDKGIYGIDVSSSFYRDNKMTCVGIQGSGDGKYRPFEVISRNGIRIALLSYTYGTNGIAVSDKYPYAVHYLPDGEDFFSGDRIRSDIKEAGEQADFVVVFVHWGDEYCTDITDYQRDMAELFADAGADVVIGTHPHVAQPAEMLDRPDGGQMLVYYSLGNFRANQKGTQSGAEAVFTIEHAYDGARVKSWEIRQIDPYAP